MLDISYSQFEWIAGQLCVKIYFRIVVSTTTINYDSSSKIKYSRILSMSLHIKIVYVPNFHLSNESSKESRQKNSPEKERH